MAMTQVAATQYETYECKLQVKSCWGFSKDENVRSRKLRHLGWSVQPSDVRAQVNDSSCN